jgi:site-specific DNA-adenine methylase
MTYKIPVCQCGADLKYSTEIVYLTQKKINKNGRLSKKADFFNPLGVYTATGIETERLLCTSKDCLKSYECNYDAKYRVLRGDRV